MHGKESTAEKAEKKNDEKAPQYRDEAVKATADFKQLDGQVMERLRKWQQVSGVLLWTVCSLRASLTVGACRVAEKRSVARIRCALCLCLLLTQQYLRADCVRNAMR